MKVSKDGVSWAVGIAMILGAIYGLQRALDDWHARTFYAEMDEEGRKFCDTVLSKTHVGCIAAIRDALATHIDCKFHMRAEDKEYCERLKELHEMDKD